MWKCNNCNYEFDEPNQIETTYEAMYGMASEFGDKTPVTVLICPKCKDEDIEEIKEDEDEE